MPTAMTADLFADDEDIFVFGFHEIALARYLLNGFRIFIEFAQILLVGLIKAFILVYLLLQIPYDGLVVDVVIDAVFVQKAHNRYGDNHYENIFERVETLDELDDTLNLFHIRKG